MQKSLRNSKNFHSLRISRENKITVSFKASVWPIDDLDS